MGKRRYKLLDVEDRLKDVLYNTGNIANILALVTLGKVTFKNGIKIKKQVRKFPGGPVVRTQCFHCHCLGSTFGLVWHGQKLKEKEINGDKRRRAQWSFKKKKKVESKVEP